MEIDYSKFQTPPKCKNCNSVLISKDQWDKYLRKKPFVGVVWESYLKFPNFTKFFYESLKGYINERKNN